MAAAVAPPSPFPRPSSSAGLPVIPHPSSRLGNTGDLSVRGQSGLRSRSMLALGGSGLGANGLALGRQKTFVTLDGDGRLHTGLQRENLPPLSSPSLSAWPGPVEQANRSPLDKGKFRRPIESAPKYNQNELECLISEKVSNEYHGLKHLFRSNDPTGQGVVSREALQRILFSLVGHVSSDQVHRLLHNLGLHNKTYITFENFVGCFKDGNESSRKEWVSPVQKMSIMGGQSAFDEVTARERYISGAYCLSLMKERFKQKNSHIEVYLPPQCFEPDAMIVRPQVLDIVNKLGLKVTEEEGHKLWQRIDVDQTGAVYTQKFLRLLGLDENGRPRPLTTTPRSTVIRRKASPVKDVPKKDNKEPKSPAIVEKKEDKKEQKEEQKNTEEVRAPPASGRKSIRIGKKVNPRLERVTDCMFWKFEESYNALELGMQCFDFLGDGYISRVDLKKVLEEFGLPVSVMELEAFLAKCGIRTIHGQIAYKELLTRFWNRGEASLVNRIVTNKFHAFNKGLSVQAGEPLTVEQLEAKLIDLVHGEFLRLLGWLKECDKYTIGVVTQHEFHDNVERFLGYRMSDSQWEELRNEAGLDSDGLVPYSKFMEKFNVSPGSWNHKMHGSFKVQQVSKVVDPPAAVKRLQDTAHQESENRERKREQDKRAKAEEREKRKKKEEGQNDDAEDGRNSGRSLEDLNRIVYELVRRRFHILDKVFKELDRRMTGRFNKSQFTDMLRQCGILLTVAEVERMWLSFKLGTDSMYNFTSLVRHFADMGETMDGQLAPQVLSLRHSSLSVVLPTCDVDSEFSDDALSSHRIRNMDGMDNHSADRQESSRPKDTARLKDIEENGEELPKCSTEGATKYTVIEDNVVLTDEELMQKLRSQVVANWDRLKALLRHLDRMGTTVVMATDMKDILKVLHISSSERDINQLIAKFDKNKDGRFHYIDFLKVYTDSKSKSPLNGLSHKLETRLLRDCKTIRRAFRKFDSSGSGLLTIGDFKKVLDSCSVKVDAEDLYHIVAQFDTSMTGKVSYEQFITQIIDST